MADELHTYKIEIASDGSLIFEKMSDDYIPPTIKLSVFLRSNKTEFSEVLFDAIMPIVPKKYQGLVELLKSMKED